MNTRTFNYQGQDVEVSLSDDEISVYLNDEDITDNVDTCLLCEWVAEIEACEQEEYEDNNYERLKGN